MGFESGLGREMYSIVASESSSSMRCLACFSMSLRTRRVSDLEEILEKVREYAPPRRHAAHAWQLEFGVERHRIRVQERVDGEGERVEEAAALQDRNR